MPLLLFKRGSTAALGPQDSAGSQASRTHHCTANTAAPGVLPALSAFRVRQTGHAGLYGPHCCAWGPFCLDAWMEHTALCTVCTRVSRRCHENPVGTNKKTIRSWGLSRSSNPPCAVLSADGLPGPGQGGAAEGRHAVPPGVGPAPPRPLRQLLGGCGPAAITPLNP